MTLHHFIAADRELPLGSFRDQTEEGLISIVKLDPGYEMVKTKLSKPFVYEATGCLHRPGNDIRALFSYINSNIPEGEDIEVYSCWDGEEDKEKDDRLDFFIDIENLQLGKHVKLDKKKYIDEIACFISRSGSWSRFANKTLVGTGFPRFFSPFHLDIQSRRNQDVRSQSGTQRSSESGGENSGHGAEFRGATGAGV
ncbi:MAG: hypothetical protein Q8923_14850 [Bacillota bacterium]|nr:hypothetical protein [Bacillota bacterium]